jgi:hypothetical protein
MADENNDLNINIGMNPSGVESGSRRSKAAVSSVTDEAKQLEQAFKRIKAAIDPTFAAQERYNKLLQDAKLLLKAGEMDRKEYNATIRAAKQLLDEESAALMRNSAAGRAAASEARARKAQEAADARAAAAAVRAAAMEKAAAERAAAKEAAAAQAAARAEERAAIRQAAQEAKAQAQAKAAAEREAAAQEKAAAKEAAAAITAAKRQQAADERAAMQEAAAQEKAIRQQQKQAARDAAQAAKTAAQEKAQAERMAAAAAREAAKAEADAAKAAAAEAQAAQQLRASIDPAYAAQMRYNQTVQTAKKLLDAEKLSQAEYTAVLKQAKAQMDVNVRTMGRMNNLNVQIGYQMQDVVASWASGINPLVILAQQGGQTAAAMSTMGGTVGRVAAFFAGPWGAAIIGFTMVLGYLWESLDDGKKKTLDLNDAESRRTATVKDLTKALEDYVEQQRQSNNEDLQNLENTNNLNATTQAQATAQVAQAQAKVNQLQQEYDDMRAGKNTVYNLAPQAAQLAMLGVQYGRLVLAQRELSREQVLLKTSTDALTESRTALLKKTADEEPSEKEHQKRLQAITDAYRNSQQTLADFDRAALLRRQENERYNRVKEQEAQARRDAASAAREEEKATFHSRTQAIGVAGRELQKAGYSVGENNQFGGIHGNHPGMGNTAHAEFAIDVNIPGAGTEAANASAKLQMDKMVAAYQARGFRILWNGKVYQPFGGGPSYDIPPNVNQHKDHVHIEAPQSIVGKPAGSKLANELIADDKAVESAEHKRQREALEGEVETLEAKKELYKDDLYAQLQIQDEIEAKTAAFYGAQSKQAQEEHKKTLDLEYRIGQEQVKIAQETIQKKLDIATQGANAENEVQNQAIQQQSQLADFAATNGLVSDHKALQEKKRILAEETTDQMRFEDTIYGLKKQAVEDQLALDNLTADARRQLLNQLEVMEAEHQAKMRGIQAQAATQTQALNIQTAQLSMDTWRGMFQTVGQSLNNTFQGLWTRSMTVWQGLINLGDQIVYKFADMGEKVLVDWLTKQAVRLGLVHIQQAQETAAVAAGESARTGITAAGTASREGIGAAAVGIHVAQQAAKTGASVTSEAVQTGAKVTGEATRGTVGAAGAVAEIGTRAATSAAGAFSSTVVIPFIGPVAAPVAAAAALAAVLGFAALVSARGGQAEVPFDGQLSMLHKKEMVLPAWAAEPLRQQMRSGPSSGGIFGSAAAAGASSRTTNNGGDTHLHYGPQYGSAPREMNMDQLLRRDGGRLLRWLKKQQRDGAFVGGASGGSK